MPNTPETSIPPNDSAKATHQEFDRIRQDNNDYLHNISSRAGEVQANQSSTIKKLFDNIPEGTIAGTTLLKVAFLDAVQATNLLKQASAIHLELAFNSFKDELEKIAAIQPQNLAQVAAKNRVAMSRPAKVWDLGQGGPVSMGAGPSKLPQGSGTSVHTGGGILSRLGLR